MSDIDFQNGFLCGMATRGLTKSIIQDPTVAFMITRGVRDSVSLLGHLSVSDFVEAPVLEAWPPEYVPNTYEAQPVDTVDLLQLTVTDSVTVLLY
jgi:hypothetical protein